MWQFVGAVLTNRCTIINFHQKDLKSETAKSLRQIIIDDVLNSICSHETSCFTWNTIFFGTSHKLNVYGKWTKYEGKYSAEYQMSNHSHILYPLFNSIGDASHMICMVPLAIPKMTYVYKSTDVSNTFASFAPLFPNHFQFFQALDTQKSVYARTLARGQ